ncbi:putative YigZ family protein [Volucribacter psittacicida]|uniref:Putative YigZ family protein n=1 Tax=Volucribacter psittacicida TaxID=203482 RepID=A0A4R1FJ52_9PAST|nr:YigZ family protein [Volucribacter psittacicida]TCJ94040.1 putative YigZ family protein [Volucribacter psittacicida]
MSQYFIPKSAVVFEEEIKKSRFITYLRQVDNLEQARAFWQQMRQQHPNARHHCWATVAGSPDDSQQYGFSDDGEPAGTAGKPMLSALMGSHIGEICAVVVRYYGGIQLGTGGLVRAYGNGVQQALKLLETEIKVLRDPYLLSCDYGQINWLQIVFEKYDIVLEKQDFAERVHFQLAISAQNVEAFRQEITERSAGQLSIEKVRCE